MVLAKHEIIAVLEKPDVLSTMIHPDKLGIMGVPIFKSAYLDIRQATAIYPANFSGSYYEQNPNLEPGYGGMGILWFPCTAVQIGNTTFYLDVEMEQLVDDAFNDELMCH